MQNLDDLSEGEARAGRLRIEPRGTPGEASLVFAKDEAVERRKEKEEIPLWCDRENRVVFQTLLSFRGTWYLVRGTFHFADLVESRTPESKNHLTVFSRPGRKRV